MKRHNRLRLSGRAVSILALVPALATGTRAYADWMRFDNPPGPGEFQWRGSLGDTIWLDVTRPYSEQTGRPSAPSSIGQRETTDWGLLEGNDSTLTLGVGGFEDTFLVEVPVYLVDPPMEIPLPGVSAWASWGFIYHSVYGSQLPEFPTYIAGRFQLADGVHYCWVGVERDGTGVEPFAWGYDTDPYAPEPHTLVILALGAVIGHRRMRSGRS